MRLQEITNPAEVRAIALALPGNLPAARASDHYEHSLDAFTPPEYFGLLAVDDRDHGVALGLGTMYELPMADGRALGVEGLCFREADLAQQRPIWLALVELAAQKGAASVLVAPRSLNTPDVLDELIAVAYLDGYRLDIATPALQKPTARARYSAFTEDALGTSAFVANPLLRIATTRVPVEGVRFEGDGPLYRGDGRRRSPHWSVTSLAELETHCRANGLPAYEPAAPREPFVGMLTDQILHQGGVAVGAASLSTSFEVASYYATRGGQQDGLVFTVDPAVLRRHGPFYDAYASLVQSCDWFRASEFDTLVEVVRLLDVKVAGTFLERCYAGSDARLMQGGPIDWDAYVPGGLARLVAGGIDEERLLALHEALEWYWTQKREIAVDDIRMNPDGGEPLVDTHPSRLLVYDDAFKRVRSHLERVRAPDPGWDLTPFGYIAKTCRDREVFSTGPVAPEAITRATLVGAR